MGAADKRWRLIAYDIRDPKRWRPLYRLMRGYGRPMQYSVFRCRLDDRELERLRWHVARILSEEDRFLVVSLCPSCAARVSSRGHTDDWEEEHPNFMIVGATEINQGTERVGLPSPRAASKPRERKPKSAGTPNKDP